MKVTASSRGSIQRIAQAVFDTVMKLSSNECHNPSGSSEGGQFCGGVSPAKDISSDLNKLNQIYDHVIAKHPPRRLTIHESANSENFFLHEIAHEQSFDGKPQVVPNQDVEAYAKANGVPILYRGVQTKAYADAFRSGEYYAGQGVSMDGIYTTYAKDGATLAAYYAGVDGDHVAGEVMEMCLDKSAKIINSDALQMMWAKTSNSLRDQAETTGGSQNGIKMLVDSGSVAAMKGYDAIDVPDYQFMVILNRTKVIVGDKSITAFKK